jgi:ABC-2 type transport system ATP-binding protein
MPSAIETRDLTKRYGPVLAVDRLSMHVEPGEIYGFLGLNGAGKTTTIRMVLGMIAPSSGQASVLGQAIRGAKGPWQAVGYLVENPTAYRELTVIENLESARRLRPGVEPAAVGRAIERFALGPYAGRRAGALSHGNLQRLGLARAMLHEPRVLVLDEPANGLDPAGIVEVRELLLKLAHGQGVTVFMSSHILAEVARLADRIGIIHHGRLLQEMRAAELERNRRRRLVVRAPDAPAAREALVRAGFVTARLESEAVVIEDDHALDHPDEVAVRMVEAHQPPTHLALEEEDLEAYFLRLISSPEAGWR